MCIACLTWLYELFVRTLISLTNLYAGCGRATLNFIERFWLGSVRSASKWNAKCTQMNFEMNCITMHNCTEMYCNVLQTARVHWRVSVLFMMYCTSCKIILLTKRVVIRETSSPLLLSSDRKNLPVFRLYNWWLVFLFCAGRNVTIPPEVIVLNSIVLPHKDLSQSYKNEIILW